MKQAVFSWLRWGVSVFALLFVVFVITSPQSAKTAAQCQDTTVPIFRAYNSSNADHFYTRVASEINPEWQSEGVAFYAFENDHVPNTVSVYRLWNGNEVGDHFYTTSQTERDNAVVNLGYTFEGVGFHVFSTQVAGTVPVYRLWNISVADHFYTTSISEKNNAIARLGYTDEGVAFYAYPSQTSVENGTCANDVPPPVLESCNPQAAPVVTCANGTQPTWTSVLVSQEYANQVANGSGMTFDNASANISVRPGDRVFLASYRIGSQTPTCNYTDDALEMTTSLGTQLTQNYYLPNCAPGGSSNPRRADAFDVSSKFAVNTATNVSANFTFKDVCGGYISHTPYYINVARCPAPVQNASVTVISPNGGESWKIGETHNITWNSSGFASSSTATIILIDSSMNSSMTIISGTANDGSYSWTIPATMPGNFPVGNGNVYKIEVTVRENSGAAEYDRSDSNFSINPAVTGTIRCSTDAQCGANGYYGTPTCQGNDVYQNWRLWSCQNPGTINSTCITTQNFNPKFKEACGSTKTCTNGACVPNTATLTASCTASPSSTTVGQSVTFTPTVSGATGSNTFAWTGACIGSSQNCTTSYTSTGTYTALLRVTSGSQSADTQCSVTINQNQTTASVTTNTATNVTTNSATLNGTLNSLGGNSSVSTWFQWGTTTSYGNESTHTTQTATGAISANAPNLNSNTTYHFRAAAQTNAGTVYGSDSSFTTSTAGVIQCTTNSQCGTSGLTGSPYCNGNGIYQNYRTWTCNNAGTTNSNCTYADNPQQQSTCNGNQTCSGGTCSTTQTVACYSNSDCSNPFYTGNQYCNGNNVWQNYTTYTCQNAGTANSSCVQSTTGQLRFNCYGNQTCQGGSCVYNNNNNNCTQNAYQNCVGNSKYWYDSCGNQGSYVGTCNNYNTCSSHSYQQCLNGSVHWFNSCGQDEGISQACTGNQTCSGNTCINQYQNNTGNLQVVVTVRNLSSGNLTYSNSINASPANIVQFNIAITNNSSNNYYNYNYNNGTVNNVNVRDTLPANLIYNNNLTVDGVANGGNIVNGVYIGSMSPGQTRNISYQAQVGPAGNFTFGTTTLTDSVHVTGDSTSNYGTSNASVYVTRSGVLGATSVSTGMLKGNLLVDSFIIPLVVALAGLWAWRSGIFKHLALAGFRKKNTIEVVRDDSVKYF